MGLLTSHPGIGLAVAALLLVIGATPSLSVGVEKVCNDVSSYEADVVVVGAGYAGLTAARRLSKLNYSVVVLEASDATGGRTKNYCCKQRKYNVESDYVIELGGQWIGNKTVQPHAWELIVWRM